MKKTNLQHLKTAVFEDAGFTPCESLGEKIELKTNPTWFLFRRFPNRWNTVGRKIGLAKIEKYNNEEFSFTVDGNRGEKSLTIKEASFFVVDLDFGLYSASHWLETLNLPNNVVYSLNVWQAGLAYQFESWGHIREMIYPEDSEWESKQLTEKQIINWFFETCFKSEKGKLKPVTWSKDFLEIFWEIFTDEIINTEQPDRFQFINESLKAA